MKISVIGGGYAGLVTGACLSGLGHAVTIVDVDPAKVQMINAKKPPIYEEQLEDLLQKNCGARLCASTSYESVSSSDLTFICVGTPSNNDGSANLAYVKSACVSVGKELKNIRNYHEVHIKRTVPPGTTDRIVCPLVLQSAQKAAGEIGFATNPEFLREGQAVADFMHPDRVVIGCTDDRTFNLVAEVYHDLDAPIIRTSLAAAEMIKCTSNAFLATKISFSNEIGNICKHLGIDVYDVMKGVGLDQRIGPQFLNAGAGFGGSCFPKDVAALVSLAKNIGETMGIPVDVSKINQIRIILGKMKINEIRVFSLEDNLNSTREERLLG
jgi:UDPglucose 6-dehydrogenase